MEDKFHEQVIRQPLFRQPLFPDIADLNRRHRALIAYEFAQEQADWFAAYEDLYRPRTFSPYHLRQLLHHPLDRLRHRRR